MFSWIYKGTLPNRTLGVFTPSGGVFLLRVTCLSGRPLLPGWLSGLWGPQGSPEGVEGSCP